MILSSHAGDSAAWQLVACGSCVLAVPPGEAPDRLAELLAEPDPFRAVLEALVGAGITAAPPFALLEGDAQVLRVVLRGDASIVVTLAGHDASDLVVDGAAMATWSERVIEGAHRVVLRVPGSIWTVALVPPTAPVRPAPVDPMPLSAAAETTLVPRAELAAAASAPRDEPVSEPYDFLFGDTIYRTQAGASVRIPNPDPSRPGDHDGQTLLAEDLGLLGRTPAGPSPSPMASPATPAPTLPLAATLQLERADGGRERLNQPVIIGRAPSAPAAASPAPRLLTIPDDKDISRSHVRVAIEGNVVVVTDLASKNGTVITLPGAAPRTLRSGEPTVVLPGTLIDLGGGVTFTVRED